MTDGRTDGQMSITRCDLTKLDAHKNYTLPVAVVYINVEVYI